MASCHAAVADAVAEFGRVDVLVCCDGECRCPTGLEVMDSIC